MKTVNVNHKFSVWEGIFGGILQGSNACKAQYLARAILIFSSMVCSSSVLPVICVTTLMIILYMVITVIYTKFRNVRKKTVRLDNCFYDNWMILVPRKCEFMSFE